MTQILIFQEDTLVNFDIIGCFITSGHSNIALPECN